MHLPAALPSPRFVDDERGDSEMVLLSDMDGQTTPVEEEQRLLSRKGPRLLLKKETAQEQVTVVPATTCGSEISLTPEAEDGTIETTKVVTLPPSARLKGDMHTAVPPMFEGDTFKISIDMDRK
jgi:hypothetical protein